MRCSTATSRPIGLQALVTAYCVGLTDRSSLTELHKGDTCLGGANHSVGEALDFKQEPMQATSRQGCVAFRLDELVLSGAIPQPQHIKIDVDGFESKVVAGAAAVVKNPALRSLLIETNPGLADHRQMVAHLTDLGFKHDPNQVSRAARREGVYKGVAEYVFTR